MTPAPDTRQNPRAIAVLETILARITYREGWTFAYVDHLDGGPRLVIENPEGGCAVPVIGPVWAALNRPEPVLAVWAVLQFVLGAITDYETRRIAEALAYNGTTPFHPEQDLHPVTALAAVTEGTVT